MNQDPYTLDQKLLCRRYSRAARSYAKESVLQVEVANRLQERVELAGFEPDAVLDLGCGVGLAAQALGGRYPKAQIIGLDLSHAMLRHGRGDGINYVCGDFQSLPLQDNSVDLVFANLSLHCAIDVDQVFAEAQRVLRANGLLSFATFGPDSLQELRYAWSREDDGIHVHRFLDMHDLGDAMIRHGFSEPVLDVDHIQMSYETPLKAMQDLKLIGETNSCVGRSPGFTGRHRFERVLRACDELKREGQFYSTFEIVFGQAWGRSNLNQTKYMDGEVHVPLSAIKTR